MQSPRNPSVNDYTDMLHVVVWASGLHVSLTSMQQGQNRHRHCGLASNYSEWQTQTETKVLSGCVSI